MARKDYLTIMDDHFPKYMFMGFCDSINDLQILGATQAQHYIYEKVSWLIYDKEKKAVVEKGLRYGENPGQEAALFRPINGNLILGGVEFIKPGKYLLGSVDSDALIQSGKHPSKTNLTDVDNGLNILKYFSDYTAAVILKHNNPCGAALGDTLLEAYTKAFEGDPIAPEGGAIVVNKSMDKDTAAAISEGYSEVVAAPDYEEETVDILAKRKNLRIIRIKNIEKLSEFIGERFIDFKSLSDGCIIPQWSYLPTIGPDKVIIKSVEDIKKYGVVPKNVPERVSQDGRLVRTGKVNQIERKPTEAEYKDMWFAWMVETGVTSNSVLNVKDCAAVSIGAGGQDRVGMAKLSVMKAYTSRSSLISLKKHGVLYDALALQVKKGEKDKELLEEIDAEVKEASGGLKGAVNASDAFFPFRDGVDVLLEQGITAFIQPGGALRDYDVIEACNERGATMIFTGQRCFKH